MADTDDIDETDDTDVNYSMPDPFVTALELCRIASSPKTIATALRKLRKLGHDIDAAEAKLAAVQAEAAAIVAKMESDVAVLDERERALDARATEFETSLQEARDNLHEYYNNIAEADRHIRHRILSHAGLLGGYNPQLQDLPSWPQIRRLVVGLPDDLPAAPPAELVSQEVREDWTGNVFMPDTTLTRTIRGAA
jgi:hypothetical protein